MSAPATAFITGASSGIGRALARELASRGTKVAVAARRLHELEGLAHEIARDGGEAHPVELDVTDVDATTSAMQQMDDRLEGIELVVANAGTARGRWAGKLTYDDCATILDVNIRGAVATLTALLPRMVERGHGHLVGISSIAAYRGLPRYAAYSGSKAFLSTFLESLRVDLQSVGVAVTDIRPGFVRTELTGDGTPPFLVEADDAARRIASAIEKKKAVYTFPLPVAASMGTLARMPNGIYDRLMKRFRM